MGFGFYNRAGECLLCGTNRIFKYNSSCFFFSAGPAIVQAFSRRPVITETPVQSRISPCEICGGQSGTLGRVFLRLLRSSPVSIIQPLLHTHLHLHIALTRRTNQRILGTLQKAMLFLKAGSIG